MDQISILGALVALGLSWWRLGSVLGAFWDRLERLLGPNLGPKTEPTWAKNRSKHRSFFGCLLESIFGWILVDFGYPNRAKLAPRWDQKSMLTLKAENQLNAGRLAFSWLSGVQVGSKNGPKIYQKMRPTWEGVLALIFYRFWWIWDAKLEPEIR